MKQLHFTPAILSHTQSLLELMQEFYACEHLPFDEAVARKSLEEILNNKSFGYIYLIVPDDMIVGYIVLTFGFSLEFHGRDALVDELYIREPYRGKGMGTKALEFVQEVCRQEGIHALHLEVDRGNIRAQELYRKSGFKDHNRYLLTKWLD